jgi:hypothetical protein
VAVGGLFDRIPKRRRDEASHSESVRYPLVFTFRLADGHLNR